MRTPPKISPEFDFKLRQAKRLSIGGRIAAASILVQDSLYTMTDEPIAETIA
jgi:hypothetical protein